MTVASGFVTLRLASLSFVLSYRAAILGTVLLAALLIAAASAALTGSYPLPAAQAWATLLGQSNNTADQVILLDHRLPRILTALGAGAAFGLSGAMFQTMLRNPLASPDVIGFTSGAAFGAVMALVLTGGSILLGALLGGAIAALLVIGLSWSAGLQPNRLILIGVGVSLFLTAASDLAMASLDALTAADMARWLIGTLNARNWTDVAVVWGVFAALLPVTLWLSFALNRLNLSDDTVTSLGLPLSPLRLTITVTGVVLVGVGVAVAGPLPFVAFVAGPIARRIIGGGRPAILAAAATGALVTLLADVAARAIPLVHLPTGVFTALIGAPVLMWLLLVQTRKGTL
ncbi:iron chelate uptake ABC transporter family permease subunit [Phaeobacter sp.]|uniref:FecCD family ABC transporter permease n=1 Tax=Phaeobacter sp. TaxID=1902409 RepID=UPI0025D3FBBA|nr:iron chelate uptake ABC transporter family permease subunit [Phaeobacter sp.]